MIDIANDSIEPQVCQFSCLLCFIVYHWFHVFGFKSTTTFIGELNDCFTDIETLSIHNILVGYFIECIEFSRKTAI